MRSLCALALLVFAVVGCGARTVLDPYGLASSSGGSVGSGGSLSTGGLSPTGGVASSTGGSVGAAGGNLGIGGSAGNGGTAGVVSVGGAGGQAGSAPRPIGVAAGAFHSCVSFDDGSLRCWGSGGYIGSGNTTAIGDNETPDVLPDVDIGGHVVQLSAGWYETCVLLDTGNIRCFGDGLAGELGYGNTNHIGDDETPASAGDINVGGKVRQVSAGAYHTCACLENGKVRCWGRNQEWQLGYTDPATIGDDESPVSAGYVDVGGFVVQVTAGTFHTCALLDSGTVRCWGSPSGGLGYGNADIIGDDETPASVGDVDLGGKAVQIAAGLFHTCALLDTGKVRCWGGGGSLGYGNTATIGDDETPASAGDIDVGGTVKEIAVGDFATCALLKEGTVRCWGSGEHGELGYGNLENIGDNETPASAGDVDVGGRVTHIDVGFLHACAILESGAVRCWGRGSTAALGYGNTNDIGDDETPASAGDVKVR